MQLNCNEPVSVSHFKRNQISIADLVSISMASKQKIILKTQVMYIYKKCVDWLVFESFEDL